jgi:hypothetical protein
VVGHVNAELVATAASAGVALEARVNALGSISADCLGGHPSSRHTDIDKAAIFMPDRVDPGTESRNLVIGPISERVGGAAG